MNAQSTTIFQSDWEPLVAPKRLLFGDDELHVWRVDLDRATTAIDYLQQSLSADEQERARRFHFERVRRRYIVARGSLRLLLGSFLNLAPALVRFTYNGYGKPSLAAEHGQAGLHFNVSHSGELALLAFAHNTDVGVDLEMIRPEIEHDQIAERFFAPHEQAALRLLPAAQRLEGFYRCWTRKEAYIKAKGQGLSIPLERFAVSLEADKPRLRHVQDDPPEVDRWSFAELQPAPGYIAAVAVAGSHRQIRTFAWQDDAGR